MPLCDFVMKNVIRNHVQNYSVCVQAAMSAIFISISDNTRKCHWIEIFTNNYDYKMSQTQNKGMEFGEEKRRETKNII